MKRLYIILVLIVMSVSAFAQDGKAIYNKYSDLEGVQAVYISPAMFRLIGKIPNIEMGEGEVNLAPTIRAMQGFYLISSEKPALIKEIKADVTKRIEKGHYELLMEAKDNGEAVRFFTSGDEKTVRSFIMLAAEPDETTFIAIDGEMSREELEKIIGKMVEESQKETVDISVKS